ncbi:hypothetical protein C5748_25565 [Phyllobacterium phragmitis]|uniref:Uncharacterized protein n=1 Tax=Phyllobacterium phragmitis TaxID=2670329 RepID=A0A2S9IJH6_9HYPH|nr:hypothetical protein [Phyllobacterium phragmitis]PRD40693.1 hypothetical protein C5748_25565 [Phyllobacterium phragmitis]
MSTLPESYILIQLDSALEQWHDPFVRQLLERTITLRINGYGNKYPEGVIPFDASCWFASHFLICEERDGLRPIMGFQRATLQQYRRHHMPFAPQSLCNQSSCERHIEAMEDLVRRFEHRPDKLSYTGGFTIDPKLRANRSLVAELCQLMVVLHFLFHSEAGEEHEIVMAPIVRFKIDRLFASFGSFSLMEGAEDDGSVLALTSFAGEKARFMRLQRFNSEMSRLAENYRSWWDSRILLNSTSRQYSLARLRTVTSVNAPEYGSYI